MALAFVATVTGRWFVARRGLVTGILTAGGATGQLIFLPLVAWLDRALRLARRRSLARPRPRSPSCRSWPGCCATTRATSGVPPYGGDRGRRRRPGAHRARAARRRPRAASRPRAAAAVLAARRRLRDLRRVDQRPGRHRTSSRPRTTTACRRRPRPGCSPLVGIFDIAGTIASGWLTDRVDPRAAAAGLLRAARAVAVRCCRRCSAPTLHAEHARRSSSSTAWTGWPPCRRPSRCAGEHFGARGAGRLRLGLRLAPDRARRSRRSAAGVIRDVTGTYDLAWFARRRAVHARRGRCRSRSAATRRRRRRRCCPTDPEEAAAAQAHG